MKSLMEKDRALRYIRTQFKVPTDYLSKIPKTYVEMIERLISQNPEDRPNAEDLLKQNFYDNENSISNPTLTQYTYYLDYSDFKVSFDSYSKENEIINKLVKGCKKTFEKHGAKFMESSIFKPISNTFTVFMHKFDNNIEDFPKISKRKSKNKSKSNAQNSSVANSDYIKIDYAE